MIRYQLFRFCPRCGCEYGADAFDPAAVCFRCAACSFAFYQNSVPSTSITVPLRGSPGQIMLLTRGIEPCRGKLALPGGFLGYDEVPAEGAMREAKEETMLAVTIDRLLAVYLLDYCYLGAEISVLELAYLALPVDGIPDGLQTEEASCLMFYDVNWVRNHAEMLAFPEQLASIGAYVQTLG